MNLDSYIAKPTLSFFSYLKVTLKTTPLAVLILVLGSISNVYAVTSKDIADSNSIFDWAERTFPEYFSPAGASTMNIDNFVARFYSQSNTWMGVNENQVYVYGSMFNSIAPQGLSLKSVGTTENFLAMILIEQQVPGNGEGEINQILQQADEDELLKQESPVRRINRQGARETQKNSGTRDEINNNKNENKRPPTEPEIGLIDERSYNGNDNNPEQSIWAQRELS